MKKLAILGIAILLLVIALPATVVAAPSTVWHVPTDFATIQEAINSSDVMAGDTILVGPGSYFGANVSKAVNIKGTGGAVINDGPVYSGLIYGFLLLAGSDGAIISHLRFEVDFPIMNGAAVNDVTVKHCTLINPLQGISNWGGSGWRISHNEIIDLRTRCGGGIGILIADWTGGDANDNVVSHNKITGTLHVDADDCGGYDGSGIVLYADFRWGAPGAEAIANNRVVHNKVSLTSDTPLVVDVVAIGLDQSWYPATPPDPVPIVIFDNVIGFNDLRGTVLQIDFTPPELEDANTISRNLGDNRGHGIVPANIFRPAQQ